MLALPIFPASSKYRFAVKKHAGGMFQAKTIAWKSLPISQEAFMLALPIFPASSKYRFAVKKHASGMF